MGWGFGDEVPGVRPRWTGVDVHVYGGAGGLYGGDAEEEEEVVRRRTERPTPCEKGETWTVGESVGERDSAVKELAERIRASVPAGQLERKRMKLRRYKRRSCWSCPILREMDTMSGVTVLQTLEIVSGSIRALADKCRKQHEGRKV